MTGPAAAVIEAKPDHVPIARPRSARVSRADQRQRLRAPRARRRRPARSARGRARARRRDRAAERRQAEDRDPQHEHPLAPVVVAERAAQEDQRGQEERVALDDPLHLGGVGAEVALDHRQRDVDRAAVDEAHRRAEDRRDQDPRLPHRRRYGVGSSHTPARRGAPFRSPPRNPLRNLLQETRTARRARRKAPPVKVSRGRRRRTASRAWSRTRASTTTWRSSRGRSFRPACRGRCWTTSGRSSARPSRTSRSRKSPRTEQMTSRASRQRPA